MRTLACVSAPQLCHMAAVTTAKRGEVVVYIDTTNAFNAARLQQLMDASKFDDSVVSSLVASALACTHNLHYI